MSILTPREQYGTEQHNTTESLLFSEPSTLSELPDLPERDPLIRPVLPILRFNASICPHGNAITINSFRRQFHGCRRCYLVGSLINSIECGNGLGSISLISRQEMDLIETRCVAKNNNTAMLASAASNDMESMGRLIEMNGSVEVFDSKGRTLIHVACATGSIDVVKEILTNQKWWHSKYSDVGAILPSKTTTGTAKVVPKIKPIMMRDKRDRTPLRWAMRGDHFKVVDLLLNHGAKLESDLMEWMDDHKDEMEQIKVERRNRHHG